MHGNVLIQQLEYLVALARERHFGRAAAACHVSQPTLSVAIQRLERELGVVIVRRGRRFEGFTDEGTRVIAWACRIVAERDELLADLDRMRGRLTTTARIGAIPTSVPVSPLLTARFLDSHPAAAVRVEALSSREIVRRLADFDIDAGLTYLDEEIPPGYRQFGLYRERYVLLAPADDPVTDNAQVAWAQAAALRLCALTPEMRNRRIIDTQMAADGASFAPVVEADTVGALYSHVTGLGLGTIASHAWLHAFGVPPGFAARPMAGGGPGPTVGLVTLAREPTSIVVEALLTAAADAGIADAVEGAFRKLVKR
ncbi:LysR family transcriptional regulator [Mycobacterium sp. IS-1742]|uniref:LysR family transcriptional regulator n=1 Tax=Mycobacterium sp. IS-1742 TaxID=1772285 RepID=UPI00073FF8DB|nr:LysR family transcriptional regulator [Mycobacterium sp. IS-1742]KUI31687.1 LysR family transcriptional regulator [Mycobacterium sp. IS-1742]